jgi:hypothetical protein
MHTKRSNAATHGAIFDNKFLTNLIKKYSKEDRNGARESKGKKGEESKEKSERR